MTNKTFQWMAIATTMVATVQPAWTSDTVAINIPLRSRSSLVQRLNRDGVELVKKHHFQKAEQDFLKAYLYDPADPFTLNNLGYIAEVEGQLDRAQKFYKLASEQGCNAAIDRSSAKELEGKPMMAAIDGLQDNPIRVNRMNVEAIRLLQHNRGEEAMAVLKKAVNIDPRNPFTLNNLGVASEAVGDYLTALQYYETVANLQSSDAVVISSDRSWDGKSVSNMAVASERRLRKQLSTGNPEYTQAAMYDRRGVSAMNENDWAKARNEFLQAYSLDSSSAFSLNNRGFVAEMDGDLETAQYFYEKAARAADATGRVGLATQANAEGKRLFAVAADSNDKVDGALEQYSEQRHRQSAPVELTPRGGTSVDDTAPAERSPMTTSNPSSPN